MRLRFHLTQHGERLAECSTAAQVHQVLISRELLNETLRKRQVAIARHHHFLPEHILHFNGGAVRQTIVEMDDAFLFVTAAGQGACLAVLSAADSDIGVIAYEMAMLVTRVGQYLTAPSRNGAVPNVAGSDVAG